MIRIRILAAALFLSGLLLAAPLLADSNLLGNPNLEQGAGDQPGAWRTQRLMPGGGSFTWTRKPGLGSELQVSNRGFDVAQWIQSVALRPGWYRLTGELEPKGEEAEAMLGVALRHSVHGWSPGGTSDPSHGGFHSGDLYFKVGQPRDVQIVCRLSGRGSARFRRIELRSVDAPPDSLAMQLDLDEIEARHKTIQLRFNAKPFDRPTGHIWTEIMLLGVLAALFSWGWRHLGTSTAARQK